MVHLSIDFDGLIADTEYALAVKLADIATRAGFPLSAQQAFIKCAGRRSEQKFKIIARMHQTEIPAATLDNMIAQHRVAKKEVYLNGHCNEPIAGVADALDRLSGAGHLSWICSNGDKDYIVRKLGLFGLARHFNDRVYTRMDVGNRMKPNPAMLFHAMTLNGAVPDNTIHIGDTLTDARTGRNAKVASLIYVDPRYEKASKVHANRMKQAGAFATFSDFAELPDLVERCAASLKPGF